MRSDLRCPALICIAQTLHSWLNSAPTTKSLGIQWDAMSTSQKHRLFVAVSGAEVVLNTETNASLSK